MGLDSYTKLCSHFNGSNGSTAYSDPVAGAWTFEGTAQLSTAQKKFGTASLLLDGNSDYITLPDSDNWSFGTGDFTIDFWFRTPDVTGDYMLVDQYVDSSHKWYLRFNNNILAMSFSDGTDKGAYDTSSSCGMVNDTWYHLAFVRNGTTGKIFVNGVSKALIISTAFGTNDVGNLASLLYIGVYNSLYYFNGYIDELRISKGVARWASNFVTPYKEYGSNGASQTGQMIGGVKAHIIG